MNWRMRYAIDVINGKRTLGSVRNGVFHGRPYAFNEWYYHYYQLAEDTRNELQNVAKAKQGNTLYLLNTYLESIQKICENIVRYNAELWAASGNKIDKKSDKLIAEQKKLQRIGTAWFDENLPANSEAFRKYIINPHLEIEDPKGPSWVRITDPNGKTTVMNFQNAVQDLTSDYIIEHWQETEEFMGALLLSLI